MLVLVSGIAYNTFRYMLFASQPTNFHPKFHVALCFCEQDGKLLFLQRQTGKPQEDQWGVPAGKIDQEESPEQGAKRELEEETGIKVLAEQLKAERILYDRYPNLDFIMHVFRVKLTEKIEVTLRPVEHKQFSWVTPKEALSLGLMEDVDKIIEMLYSSIKE